MATKLDIQRTIAQLADRVRDMERRTSDVPVRLPSIPTSNIRLAVVRDILGGASKVLSVEAVSRVDDPLQVGVYEFSGSQDLVGVWANLKSSHYAGLEYTGVALTEAVNIIPIMLVGDEWLAHPTLRFTTARLPAGITLSDCSVAVTPGTVAQQTLAPKPVGPSGGGGVLTIQGTSPIEVAGGANAVVSLADVDPAVPGSYTNLDCTIDQDGRIIAAANGTGGGGGGAPVGSQYVVLATDATLTGERVLTPGSGVKLADGGANNPVTLSATSTVFVTNATGAGTISNKTYLAGTSPANKVLTGFDSDNDSVTIHVEVDAGPGAWQPVVTVNGGVAPVAVTNLAPVVTGSRRFSGSATISATTSGTITAATDDGATSGDVTYVRALDPPVVATAVFGIGSGPIYPGSQTQYKSGDSVRITGTQESHATRITVKDAGVKSGAQTFAVSGATFDITFSAGSRASATQTFTVFADTGPATAAGPDKVSTNTADQDQTVPTFSAASIVYPVGQEALKGVETADVSVTHTNIAAGDTYLYDTGPTPPTPDYLNAVPSPTVYAVTKTVTRNGTGPTYLEAGTNYRLTVTRTTKNGASASRTALVKIAHATPVITIAGATSRLGTDNGTLGYRDWTITIQSNQANLSTYAASVTLALGAGDTSAFQGTQWTGSGSNNYTRSMRVEDADIKIGGQAGNNYTWGACSVKNRAGVEAVVVTTNTTYSLGGFQERTYTIAAWPNRTAAIGLFVVNTVKLVCENLSKGGAGPNGGTIFTFDNSPGAGLTPDDEVDKFCIVDGSDLVDDDNANWYNKDQANAVSNSSGTAQMKLRENA